MARTVLAHIRTQWMGALALFLVIAGGTAYAANTIGSSDVIDNSLASVDLKNNQIRSADVQNESLTGADIEDQSGVDTCTHSAERLGELCVGSDHLTRAWSPAVEACADYGLRLPSLGEAKHLATDYDIPGFGDTEDFWTEELVFIDDQTFAFGMNDGGQVIGRATTTALRTLCVTTPTN